MKIPLKEFEKHIDETILGRGYSYFNKGYVDEIEDMGDNIYETTVHGSDIYNVQLKIVNDYLEDYVCDCPYDFGPVCKHVVAALFELQKEELDLPVEPQKNKKPKKKSAKQQVAEILSKMSQEEKEAYLENLILSDKDLRSSFLITFSSLSSSPKNREFYTDQIRLTVNALSGRGGFIGWGETYHVYVNLIPIFELGENAIKSLDFQTALDINLSLLSEMVNTLNYCDDSDGYIGGFVDSVLENLYLLANQDLSEKIKAQFLEYCISEFNNKLFEDWGFHVDLLRLASLLIESAEENKKLIGIIESKEFSRYYAEQLEIIKLTLMENFQTPEEIQLYKHNNRNNSMIRRGLIQELIEVGDYQKAMEYAKEGSAKDRKELPGLAKEWVDWQLKIAQLQKDTKEIIRLARYLFLYNFRDEQDYYAILKNHIATAQWPIYLEDIVKELKRSKNWNSKQLLKSIYIEEEDFESLFKLLKENPNFSTLESYEKYVIADYKDELAGLYEKAIFNYLSENVGRKHYKTAVKYLRKIKKIGSMDMAKKIEMELRSLYPRRRALIEELDRV